MDHDQIFPDDALEKLRSHKLPYVTGYYLFRSKVLRPIWFEYQETPSWPQKPYYQKPEPGKLVKLGASGWGCLLVHREVILSVRELLKGEPEIIEDDCDIYPYDLKRILRAIEMLDSHGENDAIRKDAVQALKEEIRPLRVVKDAIGSDLRFPFYARLAGYTLYGDPDVRCGHLIDYPVHPNDFESVPEEAVKHNMSEVLNAVNLERERLAKARKELI